MFKSVDNRGVIMFAHAVTAGRRGVVGSTLAFGSVDHEFEPEQRLFFTSQFISGVFTGRFRSSTAVVQSASYPPGKDN